MIIIDTISSKTTEQNILACLLKKPELIYEIDLSEDDFCSDKNMRHNKAIFRALKLISKQKDMKNSEFDMVTIVDKINKFSGLKKDIQNAFKEDGFKDGLTSYVDTLKNMRIDPTNIDIHIRELKKINVVNKINKINKQLGHQLIDNYSKYSMEDILNKLETSIFNISSQYSNNTDGPQQIGEGLMEEYMNRQVNEQGFLGYPSPYPTLDEETGGFLRQGSVTIFNAKTKVGKSIILKNIVKKVGFDMEQPIYWGSNEQRKEEQKDRLIAEITGINTKLIETGLYNKKGNEHLKNKVERAIEQLQQKPIFIDKIEGYTGEDLIRKAKYFKAKHDIVGFVWDHVKKSTAFSESRHGALRHWLGHIINSMKTKIADPLEIFVATATQAKGHTALKASESKQIKEEATAFIPVIKLNKDQKKKCQSVVGDYLFTVDANRYGLTHESEELEGVLMTLNEDKLLFEEVKTSRRN